MHTSLALTQNLTECEHFSSQLYYMAALSGTKHTYPFMPIRHWFRECQSFYETCHQVHPQKPRWSAQNRALIPSWWAKITILRAKKVGYLKIYLCSMNLHEPFFFYFMGDRQKYIYIYIHLSHQCFFWGADHSFAWLDTVIYGYPQCKHSPSSHDYGEIVKMLWL